MENSIVISPRVIDTINSLPPADRIQIGNALTAEFILGNDPTGMLTPNQQIIYAVIRFYVSHDSKRYFRDTAFRDECPLRDAM